MADERVDPRLLAAKQKIVQRLGAEYEPLSPREAIEKAYADPRVGEGGRTQLYNNFGESFLQSVGKSAGRSLMLDTVARGLDYINPVRMARGNEHGAGTWLADQLAPSELQTGSNIVGNMVGGVGGALALHVAAAPVAAFKDAALIARYAPQVAKYAPKLVAAAPEAKLALQMALQGGSGASQQLESQLDQLRQGDRTELNAFAPLAAAATSAAGMYGAGKYFNPRGEALWSKGNVSKQAGNKLLGAGQKAGAVLGWGALPASVEEGTQSVIEQFGDANKLTPSGESSTASPMQRALLGGAFGGVMEMPGRLGAGWNAILPPGTNPMAGQAGVPGAGSSTPPPNTPPPPSGQAMPTPPGATPPPPPPGGLHARAGANVGATMQPPPGPNGNLRDLKNWQAVTGLASPEEQLGLRHAAAHFGTNQLEDLQKVIARTVETQEPSLVYIPKDATNINQGMKVWKIGDKKYGRRPEDGKILDLSVGFNPADYNVIRWFPKGDNTAPGDARQGYTYGAEHKGLPSNAMISFEHEGVPMKAVARRKGTNPNAPLTTVSAIPIADIKPGALVEAVTIEFDPSVQEHKRAMEEMALQLGKAQAEMAEQRTLQEVRDWRQLKGITKMSNLEKYLQRRLFKKGAALFSEIFGRGTTGGLPTEAPESPPGVGPSNLWPPGMQSETAGTTTPRRPNPPPDLGQEDPLFPEGGPPGGGPPDNDDELAARFGGRRVDPGGAAADPASPETPPSGPPQADARANAEDFQKRLQAEFQALHPDFAGNSEDPASFQPWYDFAAQGFAKLPLAERAAILPFLGTDVRRAFENIQRANTVTGKVPTPAGPNPVNPEGSSARVVPYRASQQELAANAQRTAESINQAIETAGLPGPNSEIGKAALARSEAPPQTPEAPSTPEQADANATVSSWFDDGGTPDQPPAAAPRVEAPRGEPDHLQEAAEDAVANGFPGTVEQAKEEIRLRARDIHASMYEDDSMATGQNLLKAIAANGGIAIREGDKYDKGELERISSFGEYGYSGKRMGKRSGGRLLGGVPGVFRAASGRRGTGMIGRRAGKSLEYMAESLRSDSSGQWDHIQGTNELLDAIEEAIFAADKESRSFNPARYFSPLGIAPGARWWEQGSMRIKYPRPKGGGETMRQLEGLLMEWEATPMAETRKAVRNALVKAINAKQITKAEGTKINRQLMRKK